MQLPPKKIRILIYAILLAIVILIMSWGLWDNYFESDEWSALGTFMSNAPYSLQDIFSYNGGYHYAPLLRLVKVVIFLGYGFSMGAHAITSLILHYIVALFLFFFIYRITKKDYLAFLTALVFAATPVTILAHVWFSTYIGKTITLLIIIPAIYFAFLYSQKKLPRYLYISLTLYILGFFTGEFSYVLVAWIPLTILIFRENFTIRDMLKKLELLIMLIVFLASLGARYIMQVFYVDPLSNMVDYTGVSEILNIKKIFEYTVKYVTLGFHNNFEQYTANSKENLIIGLVGIGILFGGAILISRLKRIPKNIRRLFLLAALSLPVAGVLFCAAKFQFTRYFYYVPYIWYAIVIVFSLFIVSFYISLICRNKKIQKYIRTGIITSLVLVLLFIYFGANQKILNPIIAQAKIRKNIIETISQNNSVLPSRSLFHIWGNSTYFNDDIRVPFSRSVAHPLIIYLHYQKAQDYSDFLTSYNNDFAYHFHKNISPEGKITYGGTVQKYEEKDGIGFGFCIYPSVLFELVNENKLNSDNVFSFFYDGKNNDFIDQTDSVRTALSSGLESTDIIKSYEIADVDSNRETSEIDLVFDSKKDTKTDYYWNSQSSDAGTSITVTLKKKTNVGRVSMYLPLTTTLHSRYLGYIIEGSLDGKNWIEVLTTPEYPANLNTGHLHFYFPAKELKYLRIKTTKETQQKRPFAITELEIYSIPN